MVANHPCAPLPKQAKFGKEMENFSGMGGMALSKRADNIESTLGQISSSLVPIDRAYEELHGMSRYENSQPC